MEQKISPAIEKLLEVFESKNGLGEAQPGEAVVSVSTLTSSAASLYERMRSIVDNKEQHLIRWHTIHRTLRRLFRFGSDDTSIATNLLKELVADGFLPNNKIPLSSVGKIQYILLKYRTVEKRFHSPELFKIAVSEIEAMLYGSRNTIFADAFYGAVRDGIEIEGDEEDRNFFDIQVRLACRRAFLEDDESALLYGLWLQYFPEWETCVDMGGEGIEKIPFVLKDITRAIADPMHRRITRKLRDQSIYFTVLRSMMEKNPAVFSDEKNLEKEISDAVSMLSGEQLSAVQKMGMRAFWYILITKTGIILPIEYLLSALIFSPVSLFPLMVNLVFHPALLLVMTQSICRPKLINRDMIVAGVRRTIFGQPAETICIKPLKDMSIGYTALYAFVALILFSGLIFLLTQLGFTFVSILFFVILLAIISFFASRVRTKAKKFVLRRYEEMQPSGFLFSVVSVPFIDAGRRLSDGFRAINVFTEVMDLFIEVPFKTLIKTISAFIPFLEGIALQFWHIFVETPIRIARSIKKSFSLFIKEKKDELD